MDHRANLRAELPIAFGDETTRLLFERKVAVLRATLAPGTYAVAPAVTITRTRRGTLKACERIEPGDVLPALDDAGQVVEAGLWRFRRLVESGAIIEGW